MIYSQEKIHFLFCLAPYITLVVCVFAFCEAGGENTDKKEKCEKEKQSCRANVTPSFG